MKDVVIPFPFLDLYVFMETSLVRIIVVPECIQYMGLTLSFQRVSKMIFFFPFLSSPAFIKSPFRSSNPGLFFCCLLEGRMQETLPLPFHVVGLEFAQAGSIWNIRDSNSVSCSFSNLLHELFSPWRRRKPGLCQLCWLPVWWNIISLQVLAESSTIIKNNINKQPKQQTNKLKNFKFHYLFVSLSVLVNLVLLLVKLFALRGDDYSTSS